MSIPNGKGYSSPEAPEKTPAEKEQEQVVLRAYLQMVLTTLSKLPPTNAVGDLIDRAVTLLRKEVTPEDLYDFGNAVAAESNANPEVQKQISKLKEGLTDQQLIYWSKVEAELKNLKNQEDKGEKLAFSGDFSKDTLSAMDIFLGPAGPIFNIGRQLVSEYKDDAKAVAMKIGEAGKAVLDKFPVIQKSRTRASIAFDRMFPKLKLQVNKFSSRLEDSGSSMLSRFVPKGGKLSNILGVGKSILGSTLGKGVLALAAFGGYQSLAGESEKPEEDTATNTDSPEVTSSAEAVPNTHEYSNNSISSPPKISSEKPKETEGEEKEFLFGIKSYLTKAGDKASETITDSYSAMKQSWVEESNKEDSWANRFTSLYNTSVLKAMVLKDEIEEYRDKIWDKMTDWFANVWEKVLSALPQPIVDKAKQIYNAVAAPLKAAYEDTVAKVQEVIPALKPTAPATPPPSPPAPATPPAAPSSPPASSSPTSNTGGDGAGGTVVSTPPLANNKPLLEQGKGATTVMGDVVLEGMHPGLMSNFYAMAAEYKAATGKKIQINSGFRTKEKQAELKRKYGKRAAEPGYSMHEFGLAIDINSSSGNALHKAGLLAKYGFVRPINGEPWHVEPRSIQGSKSAIRQKSLKVEIEQKGLAINSDTEGASPMILQKAESSLVSSPTPTTAISTPTNLSAPASVPKPVAKPVEKSSFVTPNIETKPVAANPTVTSAVPKGLSSSQNYSKISNLTNDAPKAAPLVEPTYKREESLGKIIEPPATPAPVIADGNTAAKSNVEKVSVSSVPSHTGTLGLLSLNLGI